MAISKVVQDSLNGGVAGTGPAFSVYGNSTQNVSTSTWTKVTLNVEEFDTNSNFDTSNSRFTPTVAGYYQINGVINFGGDGQSTATLRIHKNGSAYKYGNYISSSVGNVLVVNTLVYLNGSTDYVELYGLSVASTSPQFIADSQATYFNGAMVRAA